jgi:hypothetical protein
MVALVTRTGGSERIIHWLPRTHMQLGPQHAGGARGLSNYNLNHQSSALAAVETSTTEDFA